MRQITDAVFTGGITPSTEERLGDFTKTGSGDTFTVYFPKPSNVTAAVWDVAANQIHGTNTSQFCVVDTPNCIPQALLDTTIAKFDNVKNTIGSSIPLPNGALKPGTGGGAYSGLFPIPTQENEYLGKYDQNLGDKDHLGVTYFFSRNVLGNNPGGNVPWTINENASDGSNANRCV